MGGLSSAWKELKRGGSKLNDERKRLDDKVLEDISYGVLNPINYLINGEGIEDTASDGLGPALQDLSAYAYEASPEGRRSAQDNAFLEGAIANNLQNEYAGQTPGGGFQQSYSGFGGERPNFNEENPFAKFANEAGFSDFANYQAPAAGNPVSQALRDFSEALPGASRDVSRGLRDGIDSLRGRFGKSSESGVNE